MALLLSWGAGAATAGADEEQPVRAACTSSVIRLCPGPAILGDVEGVRRCLLQKISYASPVCQAAVKDVQARTAPKSVAVGDARNGG